MSGFLTVISGFSGVGKGTLVRELIKRYPDVYGLSVSATSREMRKGEMEGREYYYMDKAGFENLIENGELLEYTVYNGNYYGTPRKAVAEALESGKTVILEIEVEGGLNVRKLFPEAYLIFILPPEAKTIHERLKHRGTETDEQIRNRIKRAMEETRFMGAYDDLVVNDDLEESVDRLHEMITERRSAYEDTLTLSENLRTEFKKLIGEE